MIKIIWDDRISWDTVDTRRQFAILLLLLLLAIALVYGGAWLFGVGIAIAHSGDSWGAVYTEVAGIVFGVPLFFVVIAASKKAIKVKRLFIDPPLAFRKLWRQWPPRDKVERRLMQDVITLELRGQAQYLEELFDKLRNLSDPHLMKDPWMESSKKLMQLREVRKEIARCKPCYWKKSNAAKPYFDVERTIEKQAAVKLVIEVQAENEEQAKTEEKAAV